jgi:exodeoxyribonuclease VII small subunit
MSQRRTSAKNAANSTANPAPADLAFEDAFAEMQKVIEQLEGGDLALDASVGAFERGMRLAQHCTTLLDGAELRVQALEAETEGVFTVRDIVVETE